MHKLMVILGREKGRKKKKQGEVRLILKHLQVLFLQSKNVNPPTALLPSQKSLDVLHSCACFPSQTSPWQDEGHFPQCTLCPSLPESMQRSHCRGWRGSSHPTVVRLTVPTTAWPHRSGPRERNWISDNPTTQKYFL